MEPEMILIVASGAVAAVSGVLYAKAYREAARLRRERDAAEAVSAAAGQELAIERSQRAAAETAREAAQSEMRALHEQRLQAETQLAALRARTEAEIAALRQKSAEEREAERLARKEQEETFRMQFKNLAGEILGEHSVRFRQNSQEQLDLLLKPFRDNITDFRKRVEEIYTVQTTQRGELKAELKQLMELNRCISAEAQNLTDALKGNSKVQGDWGEMLLETILDNSALTRGIHYHPQHNIKDEEGRNLRPDVVLHLPEKKEIVIDSKVSLTAFLAYNAAKTEPERRRHLAAHVASVRQHVAELGRKEYQRLLNSPDFVILFIPNEPAFLEALKSDQKIWSDAYERKVIISSPTNLFALLKLVADLWKYSDQDKHTREIAACGLKLYEQAAAFATALEGVGTALDKARDAYEDARKRLCSGNDNILRVGQRLQRTARLQTRKKFPAGMTELAGIEEDSEEIPSVASPSAETTAEATTVPATDAASKPTAPETDAASDSGREIPTGK